MKRFYVIVLICVLLFACSSCNEKYGLDGIENFQENHSDYELNVFLLPTKDFIREFEYVDIDYHYRAEYETYFSIGGTERTLVVVEYRQEVYEKAKAYCLQNLQLSETNIIEYCDYTFIENIALPINQDRYGQINSFPKWFNMFAYNDELKTLIFIGFYSPDYTSADAQNVRDNWGAFIEKHFSDIYSFSST